MFDEAHMRRILSCYFDYYHNCRTHRSLDDNAPCPREVQPPEQGEVIAISHVGGLHHGYQRAA